MSYIALAMVTLGASQCTDDLGCSLNGICDTSTGVCSCGKLNSLDAVTFSRALLCRHSQIALGVDQHVGSSISMQASALVRASVGRRLSIL
jgi:hypothetical protein